MIQALLAVFIQAIVGSLTNVLKEIFFSATKIVVTKTAAQIPATYNAVGAAALVDGFVDRMHQ